jgi:hypothetical protein
VLATGDLPRTTRSVTWLLESLPSNRGR